MKNYLALLFVVIPLFVFSQNCSHLTFTVSGDTLTLPYSSISKLVPFGNECYIQTFDMEFNEISDESYASIVAADDCNCLIEITFENGNNIAIPKKSVYRVSEGFGGSTLVESTNGTQRVGYSVQEAVSDIATNLSSCGGVGGGSIDADTLTFNIAENYAAVADANGNLVQGGIWVSPSFLNGGVRIGGYAGNDTMGIYNTAIGYVALKDAASTARDNVAIGYQALEEASEDYNVAIGTQALNEVRTGSSNTAIGYRSGYNQYLTNDNNLAIGANALFSGNDADTEMVVGANTVGQGDNTVNIGFGSSYTKAYLPDTIQTEIITNAAGDVIDVSAGAGGGSSKATFNYYGAFFSSTVPAPTGLLPTVSTALQSSPQRYNTIVVPVTAQLKKVVIQFTAAINSVSDGDITIDLQERDVSGSGLVSVESQTVAYTEDITEGTYDQIFEFTFSSSAVVGPGSAVWLEISGTFTVADWGNLIWSAYFEEI